MREEPPSYEDRDEEGEAQTRRTDPPPAEQARRNDLDPPQRDAHQAATTTGVDQPPAARRTYALRVDAALWRLSCAASQSRRELALGFAEIVDSEGYRKLSCNRIIDFTNEHVGIRPGTAYGLLRLGRALRTVPELDDAMRCGALSAAQIDLLLPVAGPSATPDERAAWIARARRLTCRDLQQLVSDEVARRNDDAQVIARHDTAGGATLPGAGPGAASAAEAPPQPAPMDEPALIADLATIIERHAQPRRSQTQIDQTSANDPPRGGFVSMPVPARVAELWHEAVDLARQVAGHQLSLAGCAESITAEFLSAVGDEPPEETERAAAATARERCAELAASVLGARQASWRLQERRLLRSAGAGSSTGGASATGPAPPAARWPELAWQQLDSALPADLRVDNAAGPQQLTHTLRALALLDAEIRYELGGVLAILQREGLWRQLRFTSYEQYCKQRLGFGVRKAQRLVRFRAALDRFPHLRSAYLDGRLTYSATLELLPVLHASNESAWVGWAASVTYREIARNVEYAVAYAFPGTTVESLRAFAELMRSRLVDNAAAEPGATGPDDGSEDRTENGTESGAQNDAESGAQDGTESGAQDGAQDGSTVQTLVAPLTPGQLDGGVARSGGVADSQRTAPDLAVSDDMSARNANVRNRARAATAFEVHGFAGGGASQRELVDPERILVSNGISVPFGYSLPPRMPGGLPRISGLRSDAIFRAPETCIARIRFWAPTDALDLFRRGLRRCRQLMGGTRTDWAYLEVILVHFLQSHDTPEARRQLRLHRVLARDRFWCRCPGCTSRARLHRHHLWPRGRGGTDEPWNLTAICAAHHHQGIHAGTIEMGGWAPSNVITRLGIDPRSRQSFVSYQNERRVDDAQARRQLASWRAWWRRRRRLTRQLSSRRNRSSKVGTSPG